MATHAYLDLLWEQQARTKRAEEAKQLSYAEAAQEAREYLERTEKQRASRLATVARTPSRAPTIAAGAVPVTSGGQQAGKVRFAC